MAVVKLYDLARMTTATTGQGAITLGAAVPPYLTFQQAGVQDGDTIRYAIYDPANNGSEIGTGVYTASGTSLTRSPTTSTGVSNAAINLSGSAQVFITASMFDIATSVYDVIKYKADPTGQTDSSTAILTAFNACVQTGGVLFFPRGQYLAAAGLTLNNTSSTYIRLQGEGLYTSRLTNNGADTTILTLTGDGFDIRDMGFFGRGAINASTTAFGATNSVIVSNTHCDFHYAVIYGGYYNLDYPSPDHEQDVEGCVFGFSYGPALVHNGTWFFRCDFDASTPVGGAMTYQGAWAQSTAYNQGDCVKLGSYILQCSVAGTSSSTGTGPTLANYNVNMPDGTVVWLLVAPYAYSGLIIDGGDNQATITDCDCSGPFGSGCIVVGQASNASNASFIGATPGNVALWGTSPYGIILYGSEFALIDACTINVTAASAIGVCVTSGVFGPTNITGCQIAGTGTAASAIGVFINGAGVTVSGNQIENVAIGVSVAANVSKFTVTGNIMSLPASATGVAIVSGTSDFYTVSGNTAYGTSVTQTSDGGSGTHKFVGANAGPIIDANLSLINTKISTTLTVPTIYGGTATGSTLTLVSTSNGSPSGDILDLQATSVVVNNLSGTGTALLQLGGGVNGGSTGNLVFVNATSGTLTVKPPTGALGSAVLTLPDVTDTLVGLAATQMLTNKTYSGVSLTLTGNQSIAAWTTLGLRYINPAVSYTDTSSSGTVAAAYTDLFGASTILASSATTYTTYFGSYFKAPVASTNVTFTNSYAVGVDSLYSAGTIVSNLNAVVPTTLTIGSWGNGVRLVALDATTAGYSVSTFGAVGQNSFVRYDGTQASPTALLSGDEIGRFTFSGATSSSTVKGNAGKIACLAAENWSTTAYGTYIAFSTMVAGGGSPSLTEKFRFQASGGLSVGSANIATDPGAGGILATDVYSNDASFLVRTKTTLNTGAGSSAGTLTNAPSIGNPTKWIPIDDNGTTRYIPAW